MLSRIMRHPAGLMRKALRRNFLAHPFHPLVGREAPAPLPDYWQLRVSQPGLTLFSPPPTLPAAAPVGLVHVLHPETALLPLQDGRASSFLARDRMPAPASGKAVGPYR